MDYKKYIISLFMTLSLIVSTVCSANTDRSLVLLKALTDAQGPSGFEGPVRDIIYPIWKRYMSSIRVDGVGNVVGALPGPQHAPKVLLMSHMDEVGYIVRGVTKEGYLEVEPLGGLIDQTVFAQRWAIMTPKGKVIGYTGMESGHIVPKASVGKRYQFQVSRNAKVDVGAVSAQDAMERLGLRPGLAMSPDTQFKQLNGSSRYLAKAIDDRAGLALTTEYLEQHAKDARPNQLEIAATVQEELGLRGARVIYNELKPDIVINLEACIAGDHPLYNAPQGVYPSLGKGPCVYIYDRSMLPNNNLINWIVGLAKQNKIPLQLASAVQYGQDGSVLQGEGEGVPVVNIGVPVRYAHQQSGIMQRSDYDETLKLITLMIKHLNEKQIKIIKQF